MKIYFLRHGLAGDREEWTGDDRLRPLTKEGKQKMAQEAETIAALKLDISWIVTSPLKRAYQTAEIVARRLDLLDRLVEDERLAPGGGFPGLQSILEEYAEAQGLMLAGHEPDFSGAITALIGGGKVVCKKGSLARVDITSTEPLLGELVWLLPPKLLAGKVH
jgi:phosphohistidine phosphatase